MIEGKEKKVFDFSAIAPASKVNYTFPNVPGATEAEAKATVLQDLKDLQQIFEAK